MTERTILVVDDEPIVAASIRRLLGADGFRTAPFADAEAALAALDGPGGPVPDAALVDLRLPGRSGLELLDELRARRPGLPVVVMTGYVGAEEAVTAFRRGAFDFLPKPFTFDELLGSVHRAVRSLGAPDLPEASPDGTRYLGRHAWAREEAGGTVLLGMAPCFARTAGAIERLELPVANDLVQQGDRLACVRAADGHTHVLRAALSGRVQSVNPAAEADPAAVAADPLAAGWLVRLLPLDADHEWGELANGE